VSSYLELRQKSMQKNTAGICAILNNIINLCMFHVDKYENNNIFIYNEELFELFDFPLNDDNKSNYFDIEKDFLLSNFTTVSAHQAFNPIENAKRLKIFKTFFRFKNLTYLESLQRNFLSTKVVGLHLRGTDKKNEITPPNLSKIFYEIEKILNNNLAQKIFLSTDDHKLLNLASAEFNENLIFFEDSIMSNNSKPIHFGEFRSQSNLQVIRDCFILSYCPYFFYSFSNVSQFALMLGLDNRQKVFCNNLL
jgi:hypothetical protein